MVMKLTRAVGIAAVLAGLALMPAQAQQAPTTAELVMLPGEYIGQPYVNTDPALIAPLLAPVQAMLPGAGAGSTTMISQIGDGNYSSAGIQGANNALSLVQSGSNNRAVQAIQGSGSAMLLVQEGSGNRVLQASVGQNNTQLLGVSGTNNDVAFLQVGDNLGGAMTVGGSNSAVVALQTGNNNYLMPSGIRGLQNQVVVVVPGRMYVFNKPN